VITLTQDERNKFSAWLRQEAESYRDILVQLEKLSGVDPIVKQKKQYVVACIIVANTLDSIEEETIGPGA